ncbi:lysine 2,3-aminomutase [Syntrophotalea acetylenivorans]|uniref:Lysine 2,3-aminomutase n=1 Tax=Syntrophotalea acetylenivorans TaxID=1842532 RepID=A0A1L3GS33_9BACT|nr:KamA family radical SAM protein [Syntrophotalea acetylenivorans]APG28729.1 lysine 2,3-aminomutase [Syntrophotalea acetylenivorans]
MEVWQHTLRQALVDPAELAERFDVAVAPLQEVAQRYPMRISRYYFDLIEAPGDAVWRQCVPDLRELTDPTLSPDPLDEGRLSPVPAVVHRYPDRVLLLAGSDCATYCRFCTRKRKLGCSSMKVSEAELHAGIDYVADHSEVRDVLLSGGDPLLLEDDQLEAILLRLSAIPHVEMVRIGSRLPVTLPERITDNLCKLLRRFPPLYLNTHFNHPRELTPQAAAACNKLVDAGVVLGNQTVLLRGVNDSAVTLARLWRGLLRLRVRPYYLHHMDLVRGTGHFRTRIETGLGILQELRGPLSGMALPHYVIDSPGGRGKIPLLPESILRLGEQALLRAPGGETIEFPNH